MQTETRNPTAALEATEDLMARAGRQYNAGWADGLEGEVIVLAHHRAFCARCGQSISPGPPSMWECYLVRGEVRASGDYDRQHGCGEINGPTARRSIVLGDDPDTWPEQIADTAAELVSDVDAHCEAADDELRSRLRRRLDESLDALAADGELRDALAVLRDGAIDDEWERAHDALWPAVIDGSETEPGVFLDGALLTAWDYAANSEDIIEESVPVDAPTRLGSD